MAPSASIARLLRSAQGYGSIPRNDPEHQSSLYQPLNTENREIRVLTILPSSSTTEPLQCHLSTTSLSARRHKKFEALSYVWGVPDFSKSITINGEERFITPTLLSALTHIRRKRRRRVVWVDQICINQVDFEERGSQVQLMRYIYSQAENVLSYIGEPKNSGELGLIRESQRWLRTSRRGIPFALMLLIEPPESWAPTVVLKALLDKFIIALAYAFFSMLGNLEPVQYFWGEMREEEAKYLLQVLEAARILYESSYWSRCWILQEVVLSQRTPVLVYGDQTFKDLDPSLLLELLGARFKTLVDSGTPGNHPVAIHQLTSSMTTLPTNSMYSYALRKQRETGSDKLFPFSHLIAVTSSLRSTEFLDTFYCFYGLLKDSHLFPAPNYGAPKALEARKLIAAMMQIEGVWDAYDFLSPSADPAIPSWAPAPPADKESEIAAPYSYFAWGKVTDAFPLDENYAPVVSPCFTFLGVRGVRVDIITAVSHLPVAEPPAPLLDTVSAFESVIAQATSQNLAPGARESFRALRCGPSRLQTLFSAIAKHKSSPDFANLFNSSLSFYLSSIFCVGNEPAGRMYQLKDGCYKLARQTLFCTSEGFFGFTDKTVREGDVVTILAGLSRPYVLREDRESVPGDVVYRLVGSAYVNGVMEGEYIGDLRENELWDLEETFVIR
ncbi:hypothetical protein K458DRAFT_100874 [Lentithecium fluviatile CBS 122367]|uniref:Heterokaryon incompatibility domain-containing protein n=1 Tax=Lentithecium fluviatile CBS 122367 TaxID=1168545 RepID=A0A6G1JJD0_9PLEO|nr:hypothetical protein K458DRAFT_100874 [Lentithecium fluviatile CBS 122367]